MVHPKFQALSIKGSVRPPRVREVLTPRVRGARAASADADAPTTPTPCGQGIDEGVDTAPGPPKVVDGEDEESTLALPRDTGTTNIPVDGDTPDTMVLVESVARRRSRETPESRYTASSGAREVAKSSQSKPSSRSEAGEAATGILFKTIEMTPVLHGSVRTPEAWELHVRSPELITQARETHEVAAWPSNAVDMGTSQNVAMEDMEGKGEIAKENETQIPLVKVQQSTD
ncbi:hypothetical protein FB451DRAFT_1517046 [Mycena latifolia]|nr:hypothetical protein FB451DRAFT_1517046 [Mycena latifolia]